MSNEMWGGMGDDGYDDICVFESDPDNKHYCLHCGEWENDHE